MNEDDEPKIAWLQRSATTATRPGYPSTEAAFRRFAYAVTDPPGCSEPPTCSATPGFPSAARMRGPARHGATNAFAMYIRDPAGNRLELYQRRLPARPRPTSRCAGGSRTYELPGPLLVGLPAAAELRRDEPAVRRGAADRRRAQLSYQLSSASSAASAMRGRPSRGRGRRRRRPRAHRPPDPAQAEAPPELEPVADAGRVAAPDLVVEKQVGEHLVRQAVADDVLPAVAVGLEQRRAVLGVSFDARRTSPRTRSYHSRGAPRGRPSSAPGSSSPGRPSAPAGRPPSPPGRARAIPAAGRGSRQAPRGSPRSRQCPRSAPDRRRRRGSRRSRRGCSRRRRGRSLLQAKLVPDSLDPALGGVDHQERQRGGKGLGRVDLPREAQLPLEHVGPQVRPERARRQRPAAGLVSIHRTRQFGGAGLVRAREVQPGTGSSASRSAPRLAARRAPARCRLQASIATAMITITPLARS